MLRVFAFCHQPATVPPRSSRRRGEGRGDTVAASPPPTPRPWPSAAPSEPRASPAAEREMFYLTTHSTHFIYSYMASDIWLRTILIVRKETRCRHIGYSFRLTARVLLYAPSTAFVTPVVEHWLEREIAQWVHPMKDRSDDPSHHERTLYLWATSRSSPRGINITYT